MTDNMNQSNHRIKNRARFFELVLVWVLAAGGSVLGSIVIAILGYFLARANYPNPSEGSAAVLGAVLGMGLSIPAGIIGGGGTGTRIVTGNSSHTKLRALIVACLVGALVSGVVLMPVAFILFLLEHI